MTLGEVAGTIGTDDGREHVLILVAVVDTAEEGEQVVVGDGVAAAHAGVLVAGQRAVDGAEVGGLPGAELGVGTGAVDAHAPAGGLDGRTDESLHGVVGGEGLLVVGGQFPGPVGGHAGALFHAVIFLEGRCRQLVLRRIFTGETAVGAETEGGAELELLDRVDLQVNVTLDANALALALFETLLLEQVDFVVAGIPAVAQLLVIGIKGTVQIPGRQERGLGQEVGHIAATAGRAHATGIRNGHGHVLAELDDVAVALLQDGEIRVGADGGSVIIGGLGCAQGTFRIGLGEAEGVADSVAAAGDAHGQVVGRGVLVDGLGEPVGTVPQALADPIHLDRHGLLDIVKVIQTCTLDQIKVFRSGDAVDTVGVRLLEAHVGVEGDGGLLLADLALAGGHEYDAVGGAGTVDGGGSRILEDVDGLDIGRVEVIQIAAGHTVDDDERVGVAVGAETADGDVVAGTRHTAGLDDIHTRDRAVESAEGVGGVLLLDVFTGNINSGTREEFLLLGTITDDDGLFEHLVVFLERDDHALGSGDGDRRVADAGDFELSARRDLDAEFTIQVSRCTRVCAGDHDGGADDRLLAGINHLTADGTILGGGLKTPP